MGPGRFSGIVHRLVQADVLERAHREHEVEGGREIRRGGQVDDVQIAHARCALVLVDDGVPDVVPCREVVGEDVADLEDPQRAGRGRAHSRDHGVELRRGQWDLDGALVEPGVVVGRPLVGAVDAVVDEPGGGWPAGERPAGQPSAGPRGAVGDDGSDAPRTGMAEDSPGDHCSGHGGESRGPGDHGSAPFCAIRSSMVGDWLRCVDRGVTGRRFSCAQRHERLTTGVVVAGCDRVEDDGSARPAGGLDPQT